MFIPYQCVRPKRAIKEIARLWNFVRLFHTKPLSDFSAKRSQKSLSDFLIFKPGATTFVIANSFLPLVSCENTRNSTPQLLLMRRAPSVVIYPPPPRPPVVRQPGSAPGRPAPPSSHSLSRALVTHQRQPPPNPRHPRQGHKPTSRQWHSRKASSLPEPSQQLLIDLN